MILVLRLVHILSGVFWVGTMMFNSAFLFPALKEAGPDGAKVAAGLAKRRFMIVMPIVALLTIASGIWLFSVVSGGGQPTFMQTRQAKTLIVGAICAIVAFLIGIIVVRPAMTKAMAVGQSDPSRAQSLRIRADNAGRVVTLLLVLAAAAMAMARYVG